MIARRCFPLISLVVLLVLAGCGRSADTVDAETDPNTGGGCSSCAPDPIAAAQAFVSEWRVGDGGTIFLPLLEKTADMEDRDKYPSYAMSLPATVKKVDYKYDFTVDWGDGSTSQVTSFDDPDTKHTYKQGGAYTVRITGLMEAMRGSSRNDEIDNSSYLMSVSDLGDVGLKALFYTFSNLNIRTVSGGDTAEVEIMAGVFARSMFLDADVGTWDTAKVVTMRELFRDTSTNPDVSKWDTASVTDMSAMFARSIAANPEVSKWNTSSVTDMNNMFYLAVSANPDVSQWNTANVTDMSSMFGLAIAANPDVSKWNTASVTKMNGMFAYTNSANPDVSKWDTANVASMVRMFAHTSSANPDVSKWNTSSVTDMAGMFTRASAAKPDVSQWDTGKVTSMWEMFKLAKKAQPDMSNWSFAKIENMDGMFSGLTLEDESYDSLLKRINATATSAEVTLDAGKSETSDSDAIAARTALKGRGWKIHDKTDPAPSVWEIVMPMVIEASAEGVFDVTVKIEDVWGENPSEDITVEVALDERGRLNGTTTIETSNGEAKFTNLSPKLPAGFSLPSPVKILNKLEVVATFPDDSALHADAGVILTLK